MRVPPSAGISTEDWSRENSSFSACLTIIVAPLPSQNSETTHFRSSYLSLGWALMVMSLSAADPLSGESVHQSEFLSARRATHSPDALNDTSALPPRPGRTTVITVEDW